MAANMFPSLRFAVAVKTVASALVTLIALSSFCGMRRCAQAIDAGGLAATDNKIDAGAGSNGFVSILAVDGEETAPCTCMQQLVQQRKLKAQRQRYLKCLELAEAKRWSPQNWMDPASLVDCSRLNPDDGLDQSAQQPYQPCVCTLKSIEAQKRLQRLENYRKCDKVRTFVTNMPMNGVFWNVHNCEQYLEPGDVEFLTKTEIQSLKHYDPNSSSYEQTAKRRLARYAKQTN